MFKTKEIKTQILGEKLKEAREKIKMTLEQVSKDINVSKNYLECLEKGDYKKLPADVYVFAYLKKYTQLLNLDTEKILNKFKSEKKIAESLPKDSKVEKKILITPKKLTLVGGILVISLIFGYLWHQLNYLVSPPIIKITQPASDLITNEEFTEVSGRTESNVYLTINGKEVYVDKEGHFQDKINLESGLNILKIEARDRLGKINTVIRRVMVTK